MTHSTRTAALSRRRLLQIAGASMAVTGAGVFTMTSARAGTGSRVQILHINDMHSRIEFVGSSDGTCGGRALEESRCFGGAARLATAIRQRRDAMAAEGVPVLTLDAGDQSQGTLFYTTYGGKAEVEMMNMIGFDAMTLGNHEFNQGPDSLAEMLATAQFPIVSGNTRVDAGHPLAALIRDHLIIERGDVKIGILGVTTPDTVFLSSPGDAVSFDNPAEHLNAAAARLRAEGVMNIVVLSHLGFVQDQALAAAVDGISLIVGGHSHTLLSNTVEGAPSYATMVASPSGRAVPIVQAYAFSRYLGDLAVEFDEDGAVVSATGDTIEVAMTVYDEAPDVAARIEELRGPIATLTATPVTDLAAAIDGSRDNCRARECEMGNTVADAMIARMAGSGVTIALANGGGLRASLPEGTITLGDVLTVLPFQNKLYTMDLIGSAIVAALEHGVNGVEEAQGRFPQVAGLRFRLDVTVAPNEGRVSEVEVRTADGWAPLDPDAVYTIVTNDFMAGGGDGYAMLRDLGTNRYDTAIDLADALAEYLSVNAPFAPVLDGRILQ
jgi:5'-nucleotidase / UDP-sugar diphosphatase